MFARLLVEVSSDERSLSDEKFQERVAQFLAARNARREPEKYDFVVGMSPEQETDFYRIIMAQIEVVELKAFLGC
jgi:hypothetical protein